MASLGIWVDLGRDYHRNRIHVPGFFRKAGGEIKAWGEVWRRVILLGWIVGLTNYLFHYPRLQPKWYTIQDMLRFDELEIALIIIGVAFIIYAMRTKK